MRKVLKDAREVAHVWMSQSQPEGRAGHVSFHGGTIYSYGTSIAAIVCGVDGSLAIQVTPYSPSSSTSTHIGIIKDAFDPALPVFHIPPGCEPEPAYWRLIRTEVEAVMFRTTGKVRDRRYLEIQRIVAEGNRYAEWAGCPWRLTLPDTLGAAITLVADRLENERAERESKAKREAIAKKRKNAAYRRNHVADLLLWRVTGKETDDRSHWLDFSAWPGTFLRVDGEEVETSRGARVPLTAAKRTFLFVEKIREAKGGWQSNGTTHRVGPFSLDSVSSKGDVKVGCHEILWPEIELLAKSQGWM